MPDVREGWSPVEQRDLAPTYDQVAAQQRQIESQQDTSKMLNLALDSTQVLAGGYRAWERFNTDFQPDPNFKVDPEQQKAMRLEFGDERSKEILEGSKSQAELNGKISYNRDDIKRNQDMASYGAVGVGAQLVSSVLDPVGWGLALATGPLGGGAKVTQLARVARMASISGIENAAMTAALKEGDTQMHNSDVFYAGLLGAGMGGTIGAATRARARPEPTPADRVTPDYEGKPPVQQGDEDLAHIVDGADDFDTALRGAANDNAEYDAWMAARADPSVQGRDAADYNAWLDRNTRTDANARDVQDYSTWLASNTRDQDVTLSGNIDIADKVDDLRYRSSLRPSRADRAEVKSGISKEQENLSNLKQQQVDARAAEAARRGAPASQADELNSTVSIRAISRQFDDDIAASEARLKGLMTKQAHQEGVGAAKAELKRFTSLTREQQLAELGSGRKLMDTDLDLHMKKALDDHYAARPERLLTRLKQEEADRVSNALDNPDAPNITPEEAMKGFGPQGGSVGAAKVDDASVSFDDFALTDNMEGLMDQIRAEAIASDVTPIRIPGGSVSSHILSSKNPYMRGLGLRFLENAQGGSAVGKTASILSDVNNNLIRSAERNSWNDGWDAWCREQGKNPLEFLKAHSVERFNNEIYSAIARGIPDDLPESVKLAAQGISDKFKRALEIRQQAGEAGFENVKSSVDYMPTLFNGPKIATATSANGANPVIEVLSLGYQTGKFKLSKKSADVVAQLQHARAMDSTLSSRLSFEKVVSQSDRSAFVEGLRASGVPDHVIDDFIEGQELADLAGSMSSRAKVSMGINTQAQVGNLKVQDLLHTNVGEIAENYGKEAAAGAAFARMGFNTRASVLSAIDAAERSGRNMGLPAKTVAAEAEQLRDSVKLMYGNTLDSDPNSAIVRATRRMRELTTVTMLNQMGFAQAPEVARGLVKMGLGTILKSVPATGFFRSRGVRAGGKAQGKLLEPELREIEENLGYIGEDNWLTGWATRHDEFGESPDTVSRLGRLLDNTLAMGSRANVVLSGFKAIQGGTEKVMVRSIAKRLKEHLEGGRVLPKRDLDEIGLTEDVMGRLKKHYDDNPRYDEFNGRQVRMLNFDKMDPDLKESVAMGIRRMQGRLVQRHFAGDEGIWMHKWWGKALAQFKSFSIVSLEKQMIHDARGDKAQAAQIFAWSAFLAYAAYGTQMNLQAIGRNDRDKFLKEKFESGNLAFGVFNKMPQVAVMGLAGDGLGTLGLLPKSMMNAPGRTGFNQMDFGGLVPAGGMAGKYTDIIKTMADYASGDDNVNAHKVVDKVRRVIPLANAIGIGQATKASVDLLEDNK